ncbi:MAG TPA: hypothetical protein P5550_01590 [Bacteroidales bacterium]|nr:hypothetical protein [Bacteroidales bacterium]HRZ76826.1 hypothetical protein [Bacteroidales bacterium]
MVRKFLYSYNEELMVLFKYYYGKVSLADIRESWAHAFEHDLIPPGTKAFVLDYREATFDLPLTDTRGIAAFYRNNLRYFQDARIAIITERPDQVVIPTLVEQLDDGYSSRPFFTMEAAVAWVTGPIP